MIIEVLVEGESAPRRYRVMRDGGDVCIRALGEGDESSGEVLQIDWRSPDPGVYSLLIKGRSYDVHIDEPPAGSDPLEVHLLSHTVRLHASDARKRRVGKEASGPDGPAPILAPMPGKVVRVLAAEGTEVARGDGIIVLEAMKMENELKAPRDGTIASIRVQEGQGVEGGALLATIE